LVDRWNLLALAEEEDFLVLEDNVYGFTVDIVDELPPLKAIGHFHRVVHIGTFAKIVVPGTRVGFAIADQPVHDRGVLADLKSMVTVNTSPLCRAVVGGLLLSPGGSLRRLGQDKGALYRHNLELLLDALYRHLTPAPTGITWERPRGGFFVQVRLPSRSTPRYSRSPPCGTACCGPNVDVLPRPGSGNRVLRLSCSYLDPVSIDTGIGRFATFLREQTAGTDDLGVRPRKRHSRTHPPDLTGGEPPVARLAIVYDIGAAVPLDILMSLDGYAEPIFVLPESAHGNDLAAMLADLALVSSVDEVADLNPQGITTFSDFQLETTALLAERLGLPFHSPATAHDIVRKHRQRTILNRHGVGHTPTALITDEESAHAAAETMPLPAVLKPNRGVGGSDTYLVESTDDLLALTGDLLDQEHCHADDGYVLESRLRGVPVEEPWGSYISVESMVCGGEIQHIGVTGKFALSPPFRERGGFVPPVPDSFDHDIVMDVTTRALTALDVGNSICHTELMLTADGPQIIEVNGRVGGNIHDLFLRGHGIGLLELAARIALGETPKIESSTSTSVAFHYFGLAPLDARRLASVRGVAEARTLPEVDRLDLKVKPGSPLDWRRGFRERIYSCLGRTSSHAELARLVPRFDELLDVKYE
jgi:hypothetical protein